MLTILITSPSIHNELQPINCFYLVFEKQSTTLVTCQSSLYSVLKDPNKPARISETEMKHSVGMLLMTSIYSSSEQGYFWANDTCVE